MKHWPLTSCLALAMFSVHAASTFPPATQNEVNTGTATSKFVSPATLSGWNLFQTNNGLTFANGTNLVTAMLASGTNSLTVLSNLHGSASGLTNFGTVTASGIFTGNGTGLTNVTSTTNVIYVELTGDDVTGDGSYAHPWKTIMRACSATNASTMQGTIVRIGPGTFDYVGLDFENCFEDQPYDGLKVPYLGAIIGAGKLLTTLTASNCFDAAGFVHMQDGGLLQDLTVDVWNYNPIRTVGPAYPVTDHANTLNGVSPRNFVMRNVKLYGGVDSFININSEITNAAFYDCDFYTHFDGISIRAGVNTQDIRFYNCNWYGDNSVGETLMAGPQAAEETGSWSFYGGSITIQAAAFGVESIFASGASGMVFNIFGTHVSSPGLTNIFQGGAGTVWNIGGANLADCQPRPDFAGTINLPKRQLVQQVALSAAWTNLIPQSTATVTNWWLGCTNDGIPILVATNFNNSPAGQAFFIRTLGP